MFNKSKEVKSRLRRAQEAVTKANDEPDDVMRELDDDMLEDVNGAGSPFKKHPRVPNQPINEDLR